MHHPQSGCIPVVAQDCRYAAVRRKLMQELDGFRWGRRKSWSLPGLEALE